MVQNLCPSDPEVGDQEDVWVPGPRGAAAYDRPGRGRTAQGEVREPVRPGGLLARGHV